MWKAIRKESSHQATVIIYAEGSHHSDQGMISSRMLIDQIGNIKRPGTKKDFPF